MTQILAVMQERGAPKTGKGLLEELVKRHGGTPAVVAGSSGCNTLPSYCAAEEAGAEERWPPPASLATLVGANQQRTPKPERLHTLKDAVAGSAEGIPDSRWKLAIGLMGCFGLRPAGRSTSDPTPTAHCTLDMPRGQREAAPVPAMWPVSIQPAPKA